MFNNLSNKMSGLSVISKLRLRGVGVGGERVDTGAEDVMGEDTIDELNDSSCRPKLNRSLL